MDDERFLASLGANLCRLLHCHAMILAGEMAAWSVSVIPPDEHISNQSLKLQIFFWSIFIVNFV